MSIKTRRFSNRSTHSGFTLIEVLVALFILAVGLLGAGALQMVGVQANQGAFWRSQAIYLAYDIVDRMRANPAGVDGSIYDSVDTSGALDPDPGCSTDAAGCTADQIAQLDLVEWKSSLAIMPGATATIDREAGTDNFTVTINWQERDWDAANTDKRSVQTQSYAMTVSL